MRIMCKGEDGTVWCYKEGFTEMELDQECGNWATDIESRWPECTYWVEWL